MSFVFRPPLRAAAPAGAPFHLCAALLAVVFALAAPGPLLAESWRSFSAGYAITISGLPVGRLHLDAVLNTHAYRLAGSGKITGLASLFASGEGESRANGVFAGTRAFPSRFSHDETVGDERMSIRLEMNGGAVTSVEVDPRPESKAPRVPLTDAHTRGVLDPLSALLIVAPEGGEAVSRSTCERVIPVFDGRHRFDIEMEWDRREQVDDENGPRGPVAVCTVRYVQVAGHRESREGPGRSKPIEVWLAPIEGTRALMPYRVRIDTRFGPLVVAADRFSVTETERRSGRR